MTHDWLGQLIRKSAWDLEAAGKSIFRFGQSIEDGLAKCPVQDWEADAWARRVAKE